MNKIIMVACPFCGMVQVITDDHPECCSCGHVIIEQEKNDQEDEK